MQNLQNSEVQQRLECVLDTFCILRILFIFSMVTRFSLKPCIEPNAGIVQAIFQVKNDFGTCTTTLQYYLKNICGSLEMDGMALIRI
jgi:hypothetical protein